MESRSQVHSTHSITITNNHFCDHTCNLTYFPRRINEGGKFKEIMGAI